MKRQVKVLLIILFVILLLVCYFAFPVRPSIAGVTANRYIERHYSEYGFTSAENAGSGYRSFYSFEWITSFDFQSQNGEFLVYVITDGWLPFIVQDSYLYQFVEDHFVLIDE